MTKPFSLVALILMGPILCAAQTAEEAPSEARIMTGLSPSGAFGLFSAPSSTAISVGQVAASLFYDGEPGGGLNSEETPFSFGLGLSNRVEAFGTYSSSSSELGDAIQTSILGLKFSMFQGVQDAAYSSAFDFRLMNVKNESEDVEDGDGSGYSGRLIASYKMLRQSIGYFNIGYTLFKEGSTGIKNRPVGGFGIMLPLNQSSLLFTEVQSGENLFDSKLINVNLGLKYFFFKHLQVCVGLSDKYSDGSSRFGVLLGFSFSSEELKVKIIKDEPMLLPEPPPLDDI